MSGVKIRVRADAAQATREMGKLERSIVSLDKRASAVSNTFRNLAIGLTAAFTGGALTKGITRNADAMTNLGNRVKLVTKDIKTTNATMNELFKIAERSRGSIDGAAETFNRFGLALKDSNKPVAELLKVTEAVQKAATISGAGAQSANAAIIQLGQGLASGQLRGQELNSVLEQMPRLAEAIADGMGIPFGKLREEAMAGKITAEAVYKAILEGAAEIDSEFNTLDATVSGLATVFGNEWTRAIANLDTAVGTSRGITDGIKIATEAVKFFGENIIGFSVLLSGEFLLAKIRIKRIASDIGGFIKGIFTGDVSGTDAADKIVMAYESAKKKIKSGGKIAIDFTVEKLDLLKGMLPSMDTAKSTISAFTTFISDLFKDLWKAVVGDSYWTGIFDPAHMEPGQSLAIGSSIRKFLDSPLSELKSWGTALITFFDGLSFDVYDKWQQTVTSIDEVGFRKTLEKELKAVEFNTTGIVGWFENMSFEVYDAWQQLTTSINTIGLTPTLKIEGEKLWVSSLRSMGTAYDTFNETLTTATGSDELVLPTAEQQAISFDANLKKINTAYINTKDLLSKSIQFSAFSGLSDIFEKDLKEEFEKINKFLRSSAEATAATFSIILGVAFNKKIRGFVFKYGIKGGIISAIGLLGHDEEFIKSVKNIATGFGEILAKAFSEDGDLVSKILEGLLNVASAISEGLIAGLFPEGFEDDVSADLAQKLGTGITLAAGALIISSKARAGVLLVGKKLFGGLLDGFKSRSDKEIQAATNKSISKSKVGMTSKRLGGRIQTGLRAGFGLALGSRLQTKISSSLNGIKTGGGSKIGNSVNKLGDKIGTVMSGKVGSAIKTLGSNAAGGALAGLSAKVTTEALVDANALGGFGEILDGAVAGGALAARLTEGFSPIVQIGATFVGIVVGGLLDLWNNPELLAKVKKFAKDFGKKVLDTFLNLPTIVGTAMIEGFMTAYDWLKSKLMDLGKDFVAKFIKGDGVGSTDKNSQLNQFPGETKQQTALRLATLGATKELTKALLKKTINVNQAKPGVQGFSVGGPVNGPGTGTSDDIPAMLSDGEFVMKQSAVQKFGSGFMGAINNGIMPKFRAGGGDIGRFTLGGQAGEIAIELKRDDLDIKERKALVAQLERITRLTEQQTADLTAGGDKGDAVLENLKVTSESAKKYAEDFNNTLANSLSRALHGDDLEEIGKSILDTFTSSVINAFSASFADKFLENFSLDKLFAGIEGLGGMAGGAAKGDFGGFGTPMSKKGNSSGYGDSDAGGGKPNSIGSNITESLGGAFEGFFSSFDGILGSFGGIFSGLTDSLGGLFSGLGSSLSGLFGGGGGGGMDFGDILMKGIGMFGFGFSQGGIVPSTSTSQAGKDSVPAMLMPGEVVLSKNDIRNMDSQQGSSQQSFHINVQGDVSRQTRKEIVKMIPQITGGVNATNKENNFKTR